MAGKTGTYALRSAVGMVLGLGAATEWFCSTNPCGLAAGLAGVVGQEGAELHVLSRMGSF